MRAMGRNKTYDLFGNALPKSKALAHLKHKGADKQATSACQALAVPVNKQFLEWRVPVTVFFHC